jgi:mono/diheme cytochrome c family protein
MSRLVISFYRVMIPVGLTIFFASNIAAKKKPAISPSGRDIFMDRCSACHGEDGRGHGPAVGALKIAPADLTLLTKRNAGTFPAERVKNIVGDWVDITAHGSREMPIWGNLFHAKRPADQQIATDRFRSLVSFLESIQR